MRRFGPVVILLVLGFSAGSRGRVRAGNGEALGRLSGELSALTDALRAELRLLKLYESLGPPAAAEAVRRRVGELAAREEEILRRMAARIGGLPRPPGPEVPPVLPRRELPLPYPGLSPPALDPAVLDPVRLGLAWLMAHQDEDGKWDCDGFMKHDEVRPVCDGPGYSGYDPGVTGLALLAFLGAGQTHRRGAYKLAVGRGLAYLKEIQDPEGCFGPRVDRHFIYSTAICALALSEAYARTGSPLFRRSAQAGLDFLRKARNPFLAWRYGVRPGDNDTAITGWCVAALQSGRRAGLRVPREPFDGAGAWLDKVTEPEYGRVGYTGMGTGPARTEAMLHGFPPERSESLTAEGIVIRVFLGEQPENSERIRKGTELCLKELPLWSESAGTIDMVYWFWGTLAMYQVGGEPWRTWSTAARAAVTEHQRRYGAFRGSFDPAGPWGPDGGRVYSTALCVLILDTIGSRGRLFPRMFESGESRK